MWRNPSFLVLASFGLAIAAGTAHLLLRPGPEVGPAPSIQIAAVQPNLAPPSPIVLELGAAELEPTSSTSSGDLPDSALQTATRHEPATATSPAPSTAPSTALDADPVMKSLGAGGAVKASTPLTVAPQVAPPATPELTTSPVAPLVAPLAAPEPVAPVALVRVAPAVAPQERVTVARLVVEPRDLAEPRDLMASEPRPRNMAPIPRRAPRAARIVTAVTGSATSLFERGVKIRIKKDATVYIASGNIPANDSLLEAYSADRPDGVRVLTSAGQATAVPGLLGIAAQAQRSQRSSKGDPAYSLADAMRDAIWRKKTAARLKSLTTARNDCAANTAANADGATKRAPSIGLIATC
jgi:hypothetical protein